MIPATALGVMGLIDDLRGLEPWPRLIAQTIVAILISGLLIATDTIGTPSQVFIVDAIVTILWIVGVCNSINFFDNLDGGASGTVVVITFFTFLSIAISTSNETLVASGEVIAFEGFLKVYLEGKDDEEEDDETDYVPTPKKKAQKRKPKRKVVESESEEEEDDFDDEEKMGKA